MEACAQGAGTTSGTEAAALPPGTGGREAGRTYIHEKQKTQATVPPHPQPLTVGRIGTLQK